MTRLAASALALLLASSALPAAAQPAGPPPPAPVAPSTDQPPPMAPGGGYGGGGRFQGMRQACVADMQTYCADAGDDRRARRQCMMAHQAQFSPGCQQAMAQMQAWRQSHRRGADGQGAPPPTSDQPPPPPQ